MTSDLVKSFLNRAPYDLPFEVQLANHMRKCRFLKSFDFDNYCLDVIFWFGLTIQQSTEYGIVETWFKPIPGFGYKLILFDQQNNAYVRNIFREYKSAPRALSKKEFEELVYGRDESTTKWSLKEYLINNNRIIELKSFDSWISKYPTEKLDNDYFDFTATAFSMAFVNSTTRRQYDLDEPFKDFFRHHNFGTTETFLYKIECLVDWLAQFWIQYREYIHDDYESVENHCSFIHGALLAFHSITHLVPEVIHISKHSEDSLLIRLTENSINIDWLPTVISFSHSFTNEERNEIMKQFCTRSGLCGESALIWPFKSYGITHTHSEIVKTAYKQDLSQDVFQLDWIMDELDSIWPVNIQAPVDQFGETCDWFYLSRYVAGLLCSRIRSEIEFQHKVEYFDDHQENQFLFISSTDSRCLKIILQIDEYVVPVKRADQIDGNVGHNKGISVVKIQQYMDHDRVLRRNIHHSPPNSSENVENLDNFVKMSKFVDLSSANQSVYDRNFQLKVYEAVRNCFSNARILLNGRKEMKAFINGNFHYCNAISLNNDSISKTLAVRREHKETDLITFNFLSEYEIPFIPIHSMKYDQTIVNILYKEPYSVNIFDVDIFLENEIEMLNIDS